MSNNLSDLKVSCPIAIVVITLAIVSGLLITMTSLRPIAAVLVSAPIVSTAWIFIQYHRKRNTLSAVQLTIRRFGKDIFFKLPLQRSEIIFFAGSVLIGRLLLTVLDIEWFAQQLAHLNICSADTHFIFMDNFFSGSFIHQPNDFSHLLAGALS